MNLTGIAVIAVLIAAIFTACGEGNESEVRQNARESLNVGDNASNQQAATPAPPISPTLTTPEGTTMELPPPTTINVPVAGGQPLINSPVAHYICPNNCAGSGGSAQVACPVCGTQYVHNQAYHNTATNTATTTPSTPALPQQPQQVPAQNTAGVWHYTCPSGCSGGAASAGSCSNCGAALAHNQAYHN